jgi:HEAT repeat protein
MIVVAICAAGLVMYRAGVERAPVYRLIRQLGTGNAQARSQAAVQLGLMGPKAAFADRALTSALDDPDPGVRTEAMYALVKIGSRSPRLLRALVAEIEVIPTRPLRFIAGPALQDPVAALKAIRPDAAVIVPMLDEALNSPEPSVRLGAIDVLCAVAGWSDPARPDVAAALLDVLDYERFETRKQAADALAKLDRRVQEKAVARLVGELRDLGSSRSFEASQLLPMLADGTPTAVATLLDRARGGDEIHRLIALFLLAQYGELATPAAPGLLRIIAERDTDRRIHLGLQMYWWKSFGARGAESHFRRRFPDPNAPGETSLVALGVRALEAMGGAVEQRAIRELIAVIRDPAQADDRERGAVVALGEFGPGAAEAIPALVGVIRSRSESTRRDPDPDADDDVSLGALAIEALEKIGAEGDEEVVAILAGLLEAGDARVRHRAAFALKRLGPNARSAMPALVKALKSPDVVVRRWAADALGQFGEADVRAAQPALIAALDDEDRWVRTHAAAAIGPLGDEAKEAVPKIVRLLWDHGPGDGIAKSLGQIGPDAAIAVPPLAESLNVANPQIRAEIDVALDLIMPRAPGATLTGSIAALKASGPATRSGAAYELGRLIEAPPHPAEGAIVRAGALLGAAALGEALGDADPVVRRMAAAMLGRLGPTAAVAGSELIGATRDPDDAVRRLAASALGRAAAEVSGSIPALAGMLKDPSGDVRRWAAGVLGSVGPGDDRGPRGAGHPDPGVHPDRPGPARRVG